MYSIYYYIVKNLYNNNNNNIFISMPNVLTLNNL